MEVINCSKCGRRTRKKDGICNRCGTGQMPGPTGTIPVTKAFVNSIVSSFEEMDPIVWCEKHLNLPDSDAPFKIKDCGRDYLEEPIRYMVGEATTPTGKPVVVLKGRQVGMSVTSVATYLYLLNSGLYTNLRILHCFPSLKHVSQFHDPKLLPMIERSDLVRRKRYTPDTMWFSETSKKLGQKPKFIGTWTQSLKQFQDDNYLMFDATSKDAGRLRGQTLHFIYYDEVQDTTRKAIENLDEALGQSPYGPPGIGVKIYFGTPFAEGSHFHNVWLASDQRFYHLRCHVCDKLYKLYEYGKDTWKDVWVSEFKMKCPHCGALEDKRTAMKGGQWVPTNEKALYRGYHFNQLYVPNLSKESILVKESEKEPQAFRNEVLGEFYAGIVDSAVYQDLVLSCANDTLEYTTAIPPYGKASVVMGVDWGGKIDDITPTGSWTCVLILSNKEGVYYVEHFERLETKDPKEQVERIKQLYKQYSVMQAVVDMGYGHDKIFPLQAEYGNRILGCWSAPAKNIYHFNENATPPFITINKDAVIEDVFDSMRHNRFVFPYRTREDQYITELLAMDTAGLLPVEKLIGGNRVRTYTRRGSRTIDGFMALMYAYVGVKFVMTNGFSLIDSYNYGGGRAMPAPVKIVSLGKQLSNRMKTAGSSWHNRRKG